MVSTGPTWLRLLCLHEIGFQTVYDVGKALLPGNIKQGKTLGHGLVEIGSRNKVFVFLEAGSRSLNLLFLHIA